MTNRPLELDRDSTFGIEIWLLQRLTKRRGDFLSVKSLSHAIPFGLEFSQVILHVETAPSEYEYGFYRG